MEWTWTRKPFFIVVRLILTEKLGMKKICAKIVPRNLTEQLRDARWSAVFDIQMHYGDVAASLLTWSRTLRLLFISRSKIGSERTPFCVNRSIQRAVTQALNDIPQTAFQECYKKMAAPLEKVCAGTRDVLCSWPHFSWWINKIK